MIACASIGMPMVRSLRTRALRGIEPAAEDVPFAAPVTIPEIDDRIVIEQARNIERQRVDRINRTVRRLTIGLLPRRGFVAVFARGARQQIGEPAAVAAILI